MKRNVPATLILLSGFLFFCGILFYFLPNDYWQDEVYTLYHFVFVSPAVTVTDYHSTNNHVLFSLLCNAIRAATGFTHLSQALLHPYVLRSIPVILSIASVIIFYKKTVAAYGKEAAIICSSVWLTTFPVLCFGSQMRGYALSIFIITLQYFSFARIMKSGRITWLRWLSLFIFTSLSLLCLPTNIYIEAAYGLLCLILLTAPSFSVILFNAPASKKHLIKMASAIAAGCAWTMIYYKWMLMQQPPNIFITGRRLLPFINIQQAASVPLRFAGYRLYLLLFLGVAIVLSAKKLRKKQPVYLPVLLPVFLFFTPFVFFYIHGVAVVQRTFVPLVPFFALMTGLAVQSLSALRFYKQMVNAVLLLNLVCVAITFFSMMELYKQNNMADDVEQDLVKHYYIVHFNPLEAMQTAKQVMAKDSLPVYLDEGENWLGMEYYLQAFHIPFTRIGAATVLPNRYLLITNRKLNTAARLAAEQKSYRRYGQPDEQYNLFECGGN